MTPPRIVPELACSDFPRSLTFYTHLLGFAVRYERPEEQFAYLDLGGAELMLTHAGVRLVNGALSPPFGRGLNLQIEVQDVDALHDAVLTQGAPLFLPMEERWYRRAADEVGVRQFALADPDGYLLRFQQNLGVRPFRAPLST